MTARLPMPGDDHGSWGHILNAYLAVAHRDNGELKADSVDTPQLKNESVTLAKLDPSLQASFTAQDTTTTQPQALLTTAATTTTQTLPYYAPEDYGCATTASAATNDAAIAAAIQDAIANNGIVQFIGSGEYQISQPILQDVSKFVVRGNKTVLNVDSNFTGPYFWSLYSSASYQYSSNQGVAVSGIILQGAVLNTPLMNTTAFQIGHTTYTDNCLFSIENVYVQGFATAFNYIQNTWRIKVLNSRVTGGVAVAAAPGLTNFGENMLFDNCIFESYNPQITIGTGEWNFSNCSFNNTAIALTGNCAVKLRGCHLEPHTVYPCISVLHAQAMMTLDNTTLIIDPSVTINSAVFSVVATNTTYGLLIRNLDTIQSAKYTPQVNNQNCLLVSGGGRVDMQGYSSNTNGYGYAIATSNNLIYNGDGEKGTTAGWTTYASYGGPTTFTADNTVKKYGNYSLKLTAAGGSTYVGQAVPCAPGQWVFAQCWNKFTAGIGSCNTAISLDFLSSKGDVINTIGYTNTTVTTDWTCRRQLSGTTPVAPTGTASVRVYIAISGGAGTTAWYDDIIVNVA